MYPGSVEAILDAIERWVELVENCEDHENGSGSRLRGQAWRSKEEDETASLGISALLILRNALFFGAAADLQQNRAIVLGVNLRPSLEQIQELGDTALPPRILDLICRAFTGSRVEIDGLSVGDLNVDGKGVERLLEIGMDEPEPVIYMLEILVGIVPDVVGLLDTPDPLLADDEDQGEGETETSITDVYTAEILRQVLLGILPDFLTKSGDMGFILPVLQLLSLIPPKFIPFDIIFPRLLSLLLLTPSVGSGSIDSADELGNRIEEDSPYPPDLLKYSLHLLYHLTQDVPISLEVLKKTELGIWLKVLTRFLSWDGRMIRKDFGAAGPVAKMLPIAKLGWSEIQEPPKANGAYGARPAGKDKLREEVVGNMEPAILEQDDGSSYCGESVGLGRPLPIDQKERRTIRAMPEMDRSEAWIRSMFRASMKSSITQVAFWRCYQEYMGGRLPDEKEIAPIKVAADVIKTATSTFDGVAAVIMDKDKDGNPLQRPVFVLKGMRFKRSAGSCTFIH